MITRTSIPGFFGKLPSYGDFISRQVSDRFETVWDDWLQRVLTDSRAEMGMSWLQTYLTSPMWRFYLGESVIDERPWMGVLMPSVDRVGRYFPFTVAVAMDPNTSIVDAIRVNATWFDQVEKRSLDALSRSELNLEAFLDSLAVATNVGDRDSRLADRQDQLWEGPLQSVDSLDLEFSRAFERLMHQTLSPVTLWWTRGSDRVRSSWLAQRGLPTGADYVSMLGGGSMESPLVPFQLPAADGHHVDMSKWECTGLTHVGLVREINQDAWLARSDRGCWAVADGMGGHSQGDVASALVIQRIGESLCAETTDLDDLVQRARQAIQGVNTELRTLLNAWGSQRVAAGTTIVVLLIVGVHAAVLWAGDSRLYRYRADRLELLTTDHVAWYDPDRPRSEITRAVGAQDNLDLDELRFSIEPGDRFLLSSDGVHSEIHETQLQTLLAESSGRQELCTRIEQSVLMAGASDNLTAIVVQQADVGKSIGMPHDYT